MPGGPPPLGGWGQAKWVSWRVFSFFLSQTPNFFDPKCVFFIPKGGTVRADPPPLLGPTSTSSFSPDPSGLTVSWRGHVPPKTAQCQFHSSRQPVPGAAPVGIAPRQGVVGRSLAIPSLSPQRSHKLQWEGYARGALVACFFLLFKIAPDSSGGWEAKDDWNNVPNSAVIPTAAVKLCFGLNSPAFNLA